MLHTNYPFTLLQSCIYQYFEPTPAFPLHKASSNKRLEKPSSGNSQPLRSRIVFPLPEACCSCRRRALHLAFGWYKGFLWQQSSLPGPLKPSATPKCFAPKGTTRDNLFKIPWYALTILNIKRPSKDQFDQLISIDLQSSRDHSPPISPRPCHLLDAWPPPRSDPSLATWFSTTSAPVRRRSYPASPGGNAIRSIWNFTGQCSLKMSLPLTSI